MKLKDAIIDIGYKYTKWINLFTSLMFFLIILYLIFLVLVFFGFIGVKLNYVIWVCGCIDILGVVSIILIVIRLGAMINHSWDKEIGLFIDIKHELFKVVKGLDELRIKWWFNSWLAKISVDVFKEIERIEGT